jgi:hypothetical protein
METKSCEKVAYKFSCEYCHYYIDRKSSYDKHLVTSKHLKLTNDNKKGEINCDNKQFICEFCDKTFISRVGLWKHKKKCTEENIKNDTTNSNDKLVLLLVKENAEFKNIIIKLLENVSSANITNNNTNTNSHNTTNNDNKIFNLNFFLNETCKDAMNINDFVSSIKVNLEELENTGRQGYIEGITNIILKRLNNLEEHFRPLHCSDSKREVFYIKDNNEWKKENEEKPILTKAIKVIANENIKQIKHWRDKYPDCTDSDSKKNNLYLKIVSNSMNGSTVEESIKNIDKIISNVAKEVIIDKTNL